MTDNAPGREFEATGGCQCGAVRFTVGGSRASWDCNLCHCRMCQRASGGPFMVFINVPSAAVIWAGAERGRFASSSIAQRGFCRDCGTPLTYERTPERISLALGAFDDPRIAAPTSQLVGDDRLAWIATVSALPAENLSDWLAALPEPIRSHQHPDRDA